MVTGNNVFDLKNNINGDNIIRFTNSKRMKLAGFMDSAKVFSELMDPEQDSYRKHLGLVQLFETTHQIRVPFLKDLWAGAQVLTVGEGESITYDLPIVRDDYRCVTAEDTSALYDFPGKGDTVFELILNEEFTAGDVLTYDMMYGLQAIVSDQHEVEPVGENFRHYVKMSSNDPEAYFPVDKLKAGVQYFKVDNVLGEFSTKFSKVNGANRVTGTLTNEFFLGDPRGVETFYTRKAANMKSAGLNAFTDEMYNSVSNQLDQMGGNDMFIVGKNLGNGRIGDARIGTLLEYFSLMELAQMEAKSLMFARGATIQDANGVRRINEGIWYSMRRGKRIEYARPGGLTKNHLLEAAGYLFANSNTPIEKRSIKFKAGWMAYQNVLDIFRHEALSQLANLPQGMLGADAQIGKVFTGSMNDLQMQYIAITGVVIPGLGRVQVEHDPSLDYEPFSDRLGRGFHSTQGFADSSYSLVIWDAGNPENVNVEDRVRGAKLVQGGAKNANIYYVKPEGPSVTYGYEQGRMADGDSFTRVASSMKTMGRGFWCFNQSSALLLDTGRYITIELQRLGL